jgi:hypothetical protein
LADHARDAGWTHEEYLAAVLDRELAASRTVVKTRHSTSGDTGPDGRCLRIPVDSRRYDAR